MNFLEIKKGRPFGSITTANRSEKKCSGCKKIQTLDNFYMDSGRPDCRDSYCVPCRKGLLRKTKMKYRKSQRIENKELIERVKNMPCVITGNPPPNDPAHCLSIGSGGPDEIWNVCPLRHDLHVEQHKIGFNTFASKYPKFRDWLHDNNWNFDGVKWRHY